MGQVSFDPAIEAAVNHINQFPLNPKKSKAAGDLAQIALKIVMESRWRLPMDVPEEGKIQVDNLITQPSFSH